MAHPQTNILQKMFIMDSTWQEVKLENNCRYLFLQNRGSTTVEVSFSSAAPVGVPNPLTDAYLTVKSGVTYEFNFPFGKEVNLYAYGTAGEYLEIIYG